MESILTSIKKMLGITEEYEHFDSDLIIHINSVFMILTQLGVGPPSGFSVQDKSATWKEFISDETKLQLVKSYMQMKVKLLFDPPLSSAVMASMEKMIAEAEWRLNVAAETDEEKSEEHESYDGEYRVTPKAFQSQISGLGPSKADINTTEISTNDGSLYNSARVNSRNIVMSLKLMFNPQIEDTRHDSYKYFPIKKKVTLLIETDNRICETYGYVESNEPDIFSSDETTQISIVCPDPYFYSAGPDGTNTTIFYGVEPLFEFAFSNESLTESLIEFGEIKNETEQTVYYSGDAEIGVVITIHAIGNVRNITIYNTGTREVMRIDTDKLKQLTGSGMVAGDEIIISTIKGDKSITLLRNGIYTNILNCLDKDSDWFQLSKGDNIFAYVVEEGTTNVQFKIENRTAFEGV